MIDLRIQLADTPAAGDLPLSIRFVSDSGDAGQFGAAIDPFYNDIAVVTFEADPNTRYCVVVKDVHGQTWFAGTLTTDAAGNDVDLAAAKLNDRNPQPLARPGQGLTPEQADQLAAAASAGTTPAPIGQEVTDGSWQIT